ncbi:MAG: dTDP-4-dehydrorhamnose reductase [Clostridia bacterium]
MLKIWIVGADGMLGGELTERLSNNSEINILATTINDIDITVYNDVISKAKEFKPDYIINCAAYTNVDGCETNVELAFDVNSKAVQNLADAANIIDAVIIHISTDYVFDGTLDISKSYTEDMPVNPVSVYGKSKLAGENAIQTANKFYILRTAWMYGKGNNFVRTMLNLANTKSEINVVGDQNGSPTSATTLCEIIERFLIIKPEFGIYHSSNEGFTTWAEFAKLIFKISNKNVKVNSVTSEEYPSPTKRPKNSKLSKGKLNSIGIFPKNYKNALEEYLKVEEIV